MDPYDSSSYEIDDHSEMVYTSQRNNDILKVIEVEVREEPLLPVEQRVEKDEALPRPGSSRELTHKQPLTDRDDKQEAKNKQHKVPAGKVKKAANIVQGKDKKERVNIKKKKIMATKLKKVMKENYSKDNKEKANKDKKEALLAAKKEGIPLLDASLVLNVDDEKDNQNEKSKGQDELSEIQPAMLKEIPSCSSHASPKVVVKDNEIAGGSKVILEEARLDNDVVMKEADKKSEEPPVRGKRSSYYPLDDVAKEQKMAGKFKKEMSRAEKKKTRTSAGDKHRRGGKRSRREDPKTEDVLPNTDKEAVGPKMPNVNPH